MNCKTCVIAPLKVFGLLDDIEEGVNRNKWAEVRRDVLDLTIEIGKMELCVETEFAETIRHNLALLFEAVINDDRSDTLDKVEMIRKTLIGAFP